MSIRPATRSTTSVATEFTSTFQAEDATVGKKMQEAKASSTPSFAPKTPERKRRKPEGQTTATPSKQARIKGSRAQGTPNDSTGSVFLDRPAEPHRTNAPLVTPRGSRHVIYPQESIDATPRAGIPRPTMTTGHILQQACAHLIQVEPKMQPLIEKHYCHIFCPEGLAEECDPFKSLCSGIMAQQVSGAAASSIKRKFIALFHTSGDDHVEEARSFPTPIQVAACNIAFLRQAGLSERKAEYIKGLAEKFVSGQLGAAMLINASDEEVLEKLTAVRGLGKWSVEMFACFGLKRMDIFSTGDLGVQRGMAAFTGKDVKKLKAKGGGKWKYMSEQDMLTLSQPFSPYRYPSNLLNTQSPLRPSRSVFMWYMWRVEDVDTNVVEQM